ncbi:ubiquitin-conjugating enzyme, E2 [Elysia marginata]|uniref:Ubiquitin-conjugating enzyme, E2 n=1 Tax=Elysia marginata TaxID=1093978 RepID=A0AAV4GU24_9GAST|nr:ubiquitin-conjugating enzyme, E2 [Elysia marginata]
MSTCSRVANVMFHQLKAAIAADHPNIMVYMDESNVKSWYFLATNLPGPYAGGEYLFHLVAPDSFPQDPPKFYFLTPNGVYGQGGAICISIGEFHAKDKAGQTGAYGWRPALGMIGFAREVVNGMLNPASLGSGINLCNEKLDVKAHFAAASQNFNRKHYAELVQHFQDFETSNPDHKAVRLCWMWRAAAAASALNFERTDLESLIPAFTDAFGKECWAILAKSLGNIPRASSGPPAGQPAPMSFRVDGRDVIHRVGARIREALVEREPSVRLALVHALNSRILWEIASVGGPAHAPWITQFHAAYTDFLGFLPSVSGGACQKLVPDAMAEVRAYPAIFSKLHADLARFLQTQDIDDKARLGKIFATRVYAEVAEKNTPLGLPSDAGAVSSTAASPSSSIDLDDYVSELLDSC